IATLAEFMQRVEADPRVERVDSIVSLDARLTPAQYQLIYADQDRAANNPAVLISVRDDTVVARVTSRYGQTDERSKQLVRDLRATRPVGFTLQVGGATASVLDYTDALYAQFPRAAGLVVVATYIVLLLTFRSVLLPLKAVLTNVLSILASFGVLVSVFQEGLLSNILGFSPLGYVEASLPILLFCVLFGVSMDYQVFLLSRVKEAYDSGLDNRASVAI